MIYETIQLHPVLSEIKLVAIGQTQRTYISSNLSAGAMSGYRPALIICPGGGYLTIHEDEAEYVAMQFVAQGFMVFILHASSSAPYAYFPAPMNDLENAIEYVFSHTDHYGIDPGQISILGLSTGAHLACSTYTKYKLKSIALIYPVLSLLPLLELSTTEENTTYEMMFSAVMGQPHPSTEKISKWESISFINEDTPPTFLCLYENDHYCPEEIAKQYDKCLYKKRIPHKVISVSSKKHGTPTVDPNNNWIQAYVDWLVSFEKSSGFDNK